MARPDANGKATDTIVAVRSWLVRMPFVRKHVSANSRRSSTTRLVVEIETEGGVKGYGETICLLDFIEPVLHAVVAPIAIGKAVTDHELIYRHVLGAGYYHHKRAAVMALAAVEMAMWDAHGKLCGQPLSRLLGGTWRRSVALSGYLLDADPASMAEHAGALKAQGFTQFKIKIGSSEALDIALAEAGRTALGESVHIRLDVNGAWTRTTAKRQLERLREYDIAYVEQPLEIDDLEGHAELRAGQPIPIAIDEGAYTLQDVANVIRNKAADVVLLDIHEIGGVWQARKAAGMCEAFGVDTALHSGGELGISQAANLHLAASIPDMRLAIDSMYPDFADDILVDRLEVRNGEIAVPTGPGLGVEPDLDKLERYRSTDVRGGYLDASQPGWFPLKPAY